MGKKFIYGNRRIIQIVSAFICNSNISGFFSGRIFKGSTKGICVPGLNCYSCPGAIGACPLGSLQSSFSSIRHKLPLYIIGMLLAFGILFGRAVCAFFCPFGLIQELLHKIPTPKINKSKWTRSLSLLKYGVLVVFVLLLPIFFLFKDGVAIPAFCKYICPAGTLEGGIPLVLMNNELREAIGALFYWKIFILIAVVAGSIFIYRFFCRFLCPLGAIYSLSLFNRHAIKNKCVNCGKCASCKLDVHFVNDRECIRCGECRCPVKG